MKTIKIYMIFGMIISGLASLTYADTIKMGYFLLKPHMYEKNGTAAGASVSYFEEIAKKMGHSVKWEGPVPLSRLLIYLQEGKIDGALMFTKNEKRTSYLYYPEKPYFPIWSVFVLKKDHRIDKIVSVDDVAGFRVGYLKGGNLSDFVKDNLDRFQMEYIAGTHWVEQNIKKVLKNRLDAVYDLNHVTMRYEADRMGVADQLKFIPLPEEPMYVYIVFSKKGTSGRKYTDQYNRIVDHLPFSYDDFIRKEFDRLNK